MITEKQKSQLQEPWRYRDIPTPTLRALISRNELSGFGDTPASLGMRAELALREGK